MVYMENAFPKMSLEFTVLPSRPKITYTMDLSKVNAGKSEIRLAVNGSENTMAMIVPPKGCGYRCDFCSIKNIANPDFPVSAEAGGIGAVQKVATEIDALLCEQRDVETLKLFNAGNILYGTERKGGGELNEAFWVELVDVLRRHTQVKALEIEVRIDEFVGPGTLKDGSPTPKGILRERLLWLSSQLKGMGKSLRCIFALEYVESKIIGQQTKFSSDFVAEERKNDYGEKAISFMKEHEIEWLSYAMLGGRLKGRSLTSEEAVTSATDTALFGLKHGAREVIINSQYLDPINLWEQKRDGINFYVPTEKDMVDTLRFIVWSPWLDKIPKMKGETPRVRMTTDKEDVIEGTIGPDVSPAFRQLVSDFNNAPDQIAFFGKKMAPMTFDWRGRWDDGDMTEAEARFKLEQSPDLERLLQFEDVSWTTEERATEDELKKRLEQFSEGIFLLSVDGEDVAQITLSPKDIHDPHTINSFEEMRDFPVDKKAPVLWVTNIAVKQGDRYRGKGYAVELFNRVVDWAAKNKYQSIMAGVTCDGFNEALQKGRVGSIEEYMKKNMNPALNALKRAALNHKLNFHHTDPIPEYWPGDKTSQGYGVMTEIDLPGKKYQAIGMNSVPIEIISRTSREHFIEQTRKFPNFPRHIPKMGEVLAALVWDNYQRLKDASLPELQKELTTLEGSLRDLTSEDDPQSDEYYIKPKKVRSLITLLEILIQRKGREVSR